MAAIMALYTMVLKWLVVSEIWGETAYSLFSLLGQRELFELVEWHLEDGLEMAGHSVGTLGERLPPITVKVSQDRALWIIVFLLRTLSGNGHLLVTLERHHTFIVQVSKRHRSSSQ